MRQVFDEGKASHRLQIELKSDHALIQPPDGQAVAVLTTDSFRALALCGTAAGYRIGVWVLDTEWNDKVAEARKVQTNRRKIVRMSVSLVLFGQRAFGDQVAAALGSSQQFLQPPNTGMFDCLYENPQSLQVPDPPPSMQNRDRALPATLMIQESDDTAVNAGKPQDGEAAQLADLITGLEDWFDRLPAHRSITMASRDFRILTPLFL